MSYSIGEAAVLTLIRALDDYDSDNSARQDWRQLHSGSSSTYVVLRPGAWANTQIAVTGYHRSWTTVIEVWRRYADDTKPTALQSDVATITEQIEKYPTLNGAVQAAMITGGNEMQEVTLNNGSLWARWEVNCGWTEEKHVSYAE